MDYLYGLLSMVTNLFPSANPNTSTSATTRVTTSTNTMSLQEKFDKAAADVKNLKSLPKDSDLLELYGYFKQVTVGDADPSSKPGLFDLKGKAKWEAWNSRKGTSKEAAQTAYINKVEALVAFIGLK